VCMHGGFEEQPATKRDVGEFREEIIPKIDALEGRMERVERTMATKDELKDLGKDIKRDFNNLFELLKGPEGFVERLERVEKRVGLKI